MEPVNILDARNNLSALVRRAESGEEVVIANRGRPVVRLVAVQPAEPHSAASAALWLTTNHLRPAGRRPVAELEEQIERERAGWE